ncbi:MAG: hypothetical protein ACPG42_02370 [Alphaproteobacteria bacterium]|jgi:hypothetical protein
MLTFLASITRNARRIALCAGVVTALAAPSLSQADSKEILFPLPLPLPTFNFHELSGVWWAHSLYGEDGALIWRGGEDGEKVTLRVDKDGGFSTQIECNALFGTFEEAGEDGTVSLTSSGAMMTLKGCWGDFPPSINVGSIHRFERTDFELHLFDANDLPVASFYNAYRLQAQLNELLGR